MPRETATPLPSSQHGDWATRRPPSPEMIHAIAMLRSSINLHEEQRSAPREISDQYVVDAERWANIVLALVAIDD